MNETKNRWMKRKTYEGTQTYAYHTPNTTIYEKKEHAQMNNTHPMNKKKTMKNTTYE